MSDILFAAVPIHGHVAPLLPLVRHFVDRGDRVRFLTGSRFADAVLRAGAEHVPLPAAVDFDDRGVTAAFPERAAMSPAKAIAFDFEHIFVRPGEHQHAALRDLIDAGDVDAVVCDPLFVGAALLVESDPKQRVPVVVAGVVPLSYPGPGLAPFGLGLAPLGGAVGRIRNGILRMATQRMFRPVEAAADEIAVRALGAALSGPVLDWLPHADAVCQLTVPRFEYPRPDAPASLVFTGPVGAAAPAAAHPSWWGDLTGERPVVHVTQGTIANDDPNELILPTIRALAGADVLVVVSTGGTPVEELGPLPSNVRAAEFLPYADLFPKTDVFVTNGGYGGTQFALAHGVPLVVAPGKEDKVEVAARIAWSGTGVNLKTQRPTARQIEKAVRMVLADPRYRTAAREIGADIRAASHAVGFASVVDASIAAHRAPRATAPRPE